MVDAAGNSLAVQYLMRSIKGNYFLKDQEQVEFEIALDQVIFRLPPSGIVGGTVRVFELTRVPICHVMFYI